MVFDPSKSGPEKTARLEALLDAAEPAKDARQAYLGRCHLKAIRAWLEDPAAHEDEAVAEILTLPEDRLSVLVDESMKQLGVIPGAAQPLSRLRGLSLAERVKAINFMEENYRRYVDPSTERHHWKNVSRAYQKILSEFPDLLHIEEDRRVALRLAAVFKAYANQIEDAWPTADAAARVAIARRVLVAAFPDDDIDHLLTVDAKTLKVKASYMPHMDAMCFGEGYTGNEDWHEPLFMTAHEYQHRRQQISIARLNRGELKEGSAAYYQARLFKINMDGGYLDAPRTGNWLIRNARLQDYEDQPFEEHANQIADLAGAWSGVYNTSPPGLQLRAKQFFMKAVRPVDNFICRAHTALSSAPEKIERHIGLL